MKHSRKSVSGATMILDRCRELALCTDEPGVITRTYGSPAMKRANRLVGRWMKSAGMAVHEDAVGNLIGDYPGKTRNAPLFLLGSHLDTVRQAGAYDGPLGVILAIACVESLHQQGLRLPFAIRVLGFADEEGVRFHSTYLGSSAVAGSFQHQWMDLQDKQGITLRRAIENFGGDPNDISSCSIEGRKLLGYAEAHIEQGPVLEKQNLSVGLVTAIAGQSRVELHFIGFAGHAGTTPMNLRKDALCATAEFVSLTERLAQKKKGLVATVGMLEVSPGASNVIPGTTRFTLDIRHQKDSERLMALVILKAEAQNIASARGLKMEFKIVQQTRSVPASPELSGVMEQAIAKHSPAVKMLASGAGHDAVALSRIAPWTMLFIRCKKGISHHPAESVRAVDVLAASNVMQSFLSILAEHHA